MQEDTDELVSDELEDVLLELSVDDDDELVIGA
jgi:hypothetical protein